MPLPNGWISGCVLRIIFYRQMGEESCDRSCKVTEFFSNSLSCYWPLFWSQSAMIVLISGALLARPVNVGMFIVFRSSNGTGWGTQWTYRNDSMLTWLYSAFMIFSAVSILMNEIVPPKKVLLSVYTALLSCLDIHSRRRYPSDFITYTTIIAMFGKDRWFCWYIPSYLPPC